MTLAKTLRAAMLGVAMCAMVPAAFASTVLTVYEWEGYISPFEAKFEAYAKSKGKDVDLQFKKGPDGKTQYIASSEDIFKALREGTADVITPTNNYYKAENGRLFNLLGAVDTSKLSNYPNVLGSLRSADFATKDGKTYAVPLMGGSYGLAYNAKNVSEAPTSWAALADPQHKGKTAITNGQIEANVYMAAILAGAKPADVYNIDKIDPAKTKEQLTAIVGNVGSYWDGLMSDMEKMKSLNLITTYWFDVAMANAAGQDWRFADPKEGQTVWLDNVSIAATAAADPAKNEAAHLLLDFMISPEIQKEILDMYGVIVVNGKVKDLVPAEKAKQFRVGDASFFKPEYFWQPLDSRTVNAYRQMWKEVGGK